MRIIQNLNKYFKHWIHGPQEETGPCLNQNSPLCLGRLSMFFCGNLCSFCGAFMRSAISVAREGFAHKNVCWDRGHGSVSSSSTLSSATFEFECCFVHCMPDYNKAMVKLSL